MEIKNIKIFPVSSSNDTLLAFAECELESLRLTGLGVHSTLRGGEISLTYPSKRVGQGQKFYFQPLNKETDEMFKKAIYESCKKVGLLNPA